MPFDKCDRSFMSLHAIPLKFKMLRFPNEARYGAVMSIVITVIAINIPSRFAVMRIKTMMAL